MTYLRIANLWIHVYVFFIERTGQFIKDILISDLQMKYQFVLGESAYTERCLKTRFHAVCYIGTTPRLVQIETWFLGYFIVAA